MLLTKLWRHLFPTKLSFPNVVVTCNSIQYYVCEEYWLFIIIFWWNIIMVAGINIICLQYVVMNHWCREGLGGNTLRHDVMTAPVDTVWGLFQENFYLNSTQFILHWKELKKADNILCRQVWSFVQKKIYFSQTKQLLCLSVCSEWRQDDIVTSTKCILSYENWQETIKRDGERCWIQSEECW